MKLAYNDLKSLVKEALVEILQEGLGGLLSGSNPVTSQRYEEEEEIVQPVMRQKPSLMQSRAPAPMKPVQQQQVPTLTSMYEAKTLQKMGNQLNQQRVSTQKQTAKAPVKKESINNLTDDPLMAQIFADTAKTTLQEQINAESRNGIGSMSSHDLMVEGSEPVDLFGDVANNWANLAFSAEDLKKK